MTNTLYFLCTGNSCRSQMAEGWARKLLPEDWTVKSAGIEAHGVNPKAIYSYNGKCSAKNIII